MIIQLTPEQILDQTLGQLHPINPGIGIEDFGAFYHYLKETIDEINMENNSNIRCVVAAIFDQETATTIDFDYKKYRTTNYRIYNSLMQTLNPPLYEMSPSISKEENDNDNTLNSLFTALSITSLKFKAYYGITYGKEYINDENITFMDEKPYEKKYGN